MFVAVATIILMPFFLSDNVTFLSTKLPDEPLCRATLPILQSDAKSQNWHIRCRMQKQKMGGHVPGISHRHPSEKTSRIWNCWWILLGTSGTEAQDLFCRLKAIPVQVKEGILLMELTCLVRGLTVHLQMLSCSLEKVRENCKWSQSLSLDKWSPGNFFTEHSAGNSPSRNNALYWYCFWGN